MLVIELSKCFLGTSGSSIMTPLQHALAIGNARKGNWMHRWSRCMNKFVNKMVFISPFPNVVVFGPFPSFVFPCIIIIVGTKTNTTSIRKDSEYFSEVESSSVEFWSTDCPTPKPRREIMISTALSRTILIAVTF